MARRVLVVDDSATLRRVLTMHLESGGYEVELASDGAEALERVQRAPFDLVLTDFVMPRLNGYQLAQAIRSIPSLARLPVVLVSARAEAVAARFVAQTGAAGWIAKPFSSAQLLTVVGRALGELPPDERPHPVTEAVDAPSRDTAQTVRPGLVHVRPEDLAPPPHGGGSIASAAPPARVPTEAAPPPAVVVPMTAGEFFNDLSLALDELTRTVDPERALTTVAASSSVQPRPAVPPHRASVPPAPAVASFLVTQDAAHARFTEVLGRALLPAVRDLLSRGEPDDPAVLQALRYHLSVPTVAALARELRPLDTGLRGPVVLDGLVGAVPLGEVFQLLAFQSQTGLLVVERTLRPGAPTITVALRHGRVDLCLARGLGPEFLLGRYLCAEGLDRDEVDSAAHALRGQGRRLGEALVASGRVSANALERALVRQSSELVYELLRWSGGRFRFEAGAAAPEAQAARLGLTSDNLVLEGFRRIDEWRLIAEYIPSDAVVLARDEALVRALASDRLDRDEQRVLAAVDGARTVREVVDAVAMSAFDACKILYRLLRARLVTPVAA